MKQARRNPLSELCLLTSKFPVSAQRRAISMNKSYIFPHTLGQQIYDNLDKCTWVPVGVTPGGSR